MYTGGYRKVYDKKNATLQKVRKLHIACLKNSRIICYAKATKGTVHDAPMFEEITRGVVKAGFNIKSLLADAGYLSKNNYALCRDLGIQTKETIYIGDSDADIEAFKEVGLSIAFNSKSDELKKVATHIVDSNNLSDIIPYFPK